MSIQTINPATNVAIKSFEEMSDEAVDTAVIKPKMLIRIGGKQATKKERSCCTKSQV